MFYESIIESGINKMIFHQRLPVYGNNCMDKPANEDTLINPVNPYAETKTDGRT